MNDREEASEAGDTMKNINFAASDDIMTKFVTEFMLRWIIQAKGDKLTVFALGALLKQRHRKAD